MNEKYIIAEQKNLMDEQKGAAKKYKNLFLGDVSNFYWLKYEMITTLFSAIPGALGFGLRKIFFPLLFKKVGRGVVFGRNMTIRHPKKIEIGDNVVFDDNTVIDAKGVGNRGIRIGNGVVVGRNTILSCKGGDIDIDDFANIGPNNYLISESILRMGKYVFTAGQIYMVAGGNHGIEDKTIPIYFQPSSAKGGIILEDDIWVGASATILDGVKISRGCVIGAASLVNKDLPEYSVAFGVPAQVVKKR